MKTSILGVVSGICALTVASITTVYAQEPTSNNRIEEAFETETGTAKADSANVSKLSFLRLATVREKGEEIVRGDLISTRRDFNGWTLVCDIRLLKDTRICGVEQIASNGTSAIQIRIAPNYQKIPVALLILPTNFAAEEGVRLSFSGLEKTLGKDEFICTKSFCMGGFPFEGFVQAAILKSPTIGLSFKLKDKNVVTIVLSMDGFTDALAAASTDPYGRDVSIKAAEEIAARTAKEKTDKAAKAAPKSKPVAEARPAKTPKKKIAASSEKSKTTVEVSNFTAKPNSGLY